MSQNLDLRHVSDGSFILHASCVSWNGQAVLFCGKSGAGKSSLALQLMAFGADLIADDQVLLSADLGTVTATAPDTIKGLIEARGVGLLNADPISSSTVTLVVDLDTSETSRLPLTHCISLLGVELPLICHNNAPHFAAAILQYLKGGRHS